MWQWMLGLAGLTLLSGCGTINSYASGCGGAYSGVQQDVDLIGSYANGPNVESEVPLGFDSWLADAWDIVFVALDVPLSAAMDTVVAPIGLARGQSVPEVDLVQARARKRGF